MTSHLSAALLALVEGEKLSADDAEAAIDEIMQGGASDAAIAGFLTAVATRGVTANLIAGGVRALRSSMLAVRAPAGAVDTCGTGGDGLHTVNVSTATAFVVAAGGVPVAKHGNRSASSKAGAADVLEALGARLDLPPALAEQALATTGTCFLFAQAHHAAVRHAMPARKVLGFRTLFNLMGPLANPAGVTRQLVGVGSRDWLEPMAKAAVKLKLDHAWVVHGRDGMDEISVCADTDVLEVKAGCLNRMRLAPEEMGLKRHQADALRGGSAAENADAMRAMLAGSPGAYRDAVVANAAAAFVVGGKVTSLQEGVALAASLIDTGAAQETMQHFIDFTRQARSAA